MSYFGTRNPEVYYNKDRTKTTRYPVTQFEFRSPISIYNTLLDSEFRNTTSSYTFIFLIMGK